VRKRLRDLSLGLRIGLYTAILGSAVALALSFTYSQYANNSALSLASSSLEEQARLTSHFVDELLESRTTLATTLAAFGPIRVATIASNAEMLSLSEDMRLAKIAELDARWRGIESADDPFIAQYLENEIAQELRAQSSAHPGIYGEIFLTNRFGALIASTGKLTTLAHGAKPWWQAAYDEGRGSTFIDDRGYDASVGDYVVGIVVPVMVDGQVSGILKCNFSLLGAVGEALMDTSYTDEEAEPILARSNGLIVSGQGLIPLQSSLSDDVVAAFAEQEKGWLITGGKGEESLIAWTEVSYTSSLESKTFGGTVGSIGNSFGNAGESWFIVVEQPLKQALAPASAIVVQMELIAVGVIVAMIVMCVLIGWHISKPIGRLKAQVKTFGPQNLDFRVPVEAHDEVGLLAESFNAVAEQLESSVVSRDRLTEEVSRRELVEEVLRKSEKKYRRLFENMVNGFALHEVVLDHEGKPIDYIFLDANAAFEEIVGQSHDAIVGRKVTEVLPGIENDPANWIGTYGKVALGGSNITFEQYSEPLGKWFTVLAYAPREGQFATIFEDITERKRMEGHLRQSHKLESIGTLASGVAHEINNPLMGMLNYAELVKDEVQDQKLVDYLTEINTEGNRIATIVRNLLSFSRQEGKSYKTESMSDIIERSLSLVGSTMRKDQIAIEMDIPEDLPQVKCNDQQIQQVVINLLTNAHDALNTRYSEYDENKIIQITASSFEKDGEPWIRTTVEDHGSGISEDVAARIFDPFFTTKDRATGTGLGLSVSFGIVSKHGGELTMESIPGEYTRFHIDLRVGNEETQAISEAQEA